MMKRQSRGEVVVVAMVVAMAWCGWMTAAEGADDLSTKCAEVVQKVIPCLDFASGKEAAPKKECCDATASIKESNPECLCFVIQQTHKGSPQIKSLGIQEDKLLQLPSLCKVKNATITDCPKLLGLSPSSPDAAIFTNSSKVTPATSSTQSTTPQSQNASYGSAVVPSMLLMTLTIVVAAISPVFVSIYT
ncbi:hypothetical protein PHAVU_001G262400 [Phaseolus vulgaris]|uniref:Bifunctional inhibitor/plant lipid transfer protein/seed storage helical domain-containing protein n=1 Tax=Phaseolus vulgaris TaxID=3885 RepID=V7D253_PHAVU|nr:hypothetical protein PHAVU_001G262400g [Phaseolus vulgaris]ESW35763.1 hypothetical protein PHAVU_001G262400g [Phaseolus vulgaris]